MCDGLVEVGVPGVEVGVEVHQCHRTVPAVMRPQQRVGDGVVAAERDDPRAGVDEFGRLLLDLRDGGGDVERVGRDVAGVDDLLTRER